ncbi:glutathione-regulated potassium-efflux system protein KefB [Halalkalicoccus paucihalophilus]|uniref:Glutathione-regulated potassium-efflux system protein KefB n=1 Tax=Halalkalicoccus paucihalophilus TaxID=1008153 RepID=A0A151AF75_9EURY|nr:cation:proton antiporter [Halalkalicoccus paucihalophilus]KYH26309.1 glutathione-regulated potassium-efflux system protein KefB [Halalkalicoccus paucihalophilus]
MIRPAVSGLPVSDPVLVFALAMIVFLAAPLLFQRYRLPGIVGVILVGAVIGPNALGVLERGETIVLLGEVGLIYLMFVAGLEINLNQFFENADRSVVFGLLSFVIPQAAGTAAGVFVLGLSVPAAALFASIFASHTLLAYPVANRLGVVGDEAITAAIGGTILTDTLALLVLAVVAASAQGALDTAFWARLGIGLVLFFAGVWVLVPRLGAWFFRTVNEESYFEFLFVMSALFVCAFFAEVAGVEPIVGAFLAGLVLNRLIPEHGTLMNRIEFVGNALFIPFFLLSVGMLVDARALTEGPRTLLIAGVLVVSVLVTKFAAAWVTGTLYGYSREQVRGMFGLSLGQAAAALAIVLIGFELGIGGFDREMVNAVVVMILVASVVSPAVVERAGKRLALAARETDDPGERPQRVLIPFSTASEHGERLVDLALAIREPRSAEPLRVLTVVEPGEGASSRVARAESTLDRVTEYTAGAEVAVDTQTRLNYNVASGIVNAGVENRITTFVIGWDGARSRRQRVLGDVIDQVLGRTSQLVLVSRIRKPLTTAREVVLLLPPEIDGNAGFAEAVHMIKTLADRTGVGVRGVVVRDDSRSYERAVDRIGPNVDADFEGVPDWKALVALLRDDVSSNDLVVCLSARRGTRGWHPELGTLPKSISTLCSGTFLVVYPATAERADDRQFLRFR